MDVSVVLCTYNRSSFLKGAMAALVAQEAPSRLTWELIVVDNNSNDDTRSVVEGFAANKNVAIRYVFEPQQGLSFARNKGIEVSSGAIVAFTDDDVIVDRDWVVRIASLISEWDADVLGGRILPSWDVPPPKWLSRSPRIRRWITLMESEQAGYLSFPLQGDAEVWGANMSFRRTYFDDVGLFDTTLGPVGGKYYRGEDVEIIQKGLERGKRIAYDPMIAVLHRVPRERTHPSYFRKFAFDLGEGEALTIAEGAGDRLFGVPAWLYRSTIKKFLSWSVGSMLRRDDAFELQLDFWRELGRIKGWHLRSKIRRDPSQPGLISE